jgi:UDP-N-acetylglucosamine 4-epimerase
LDQKFHHIDIQDLSFLITGGAGFIGSHIAEYLLANGCRKVRVLDNLSTGDEANIKLLQQFAGFEFIEGDIRNPDDCRKACEGMQYVSHQAALGSVPRSIKDPVATNDVNVGGFVSMVSAAADAKARRFVYASSSSVYGDEPSLPKVENRTGSCLSPYAVSKKADELYAAVFSNIYPLPLMGFRYFNIFGPRQNPNGPYAAVIPLFIKSIMGDEPGNINGDGEQTRDFTYVENAVQVNVKAMLTGNKAAFNEVYNVAVGENFSVNYLYNAIQKHFGKTIVANHLPPRAGDVRNSLADISKAEELLGYQPTTNFEAGLLKTIEYFKLHGG